MFTCGERFVKFLMFFFNFIFVICGIGLMVAGGIAQAQYDEWDKVLVNGTISGPALVIVVGVFLFGISFLGCCGAARESTCMLTTYSALVGLIFILQMAGGIAALVQKNKIEEWLQPELDKFVINYHNQSDSGINSVIDNIQKEEMCCGAANFSDYVEKLPNSDYSVPDSCCKPSVNCNRSATIMSTCEKNENEKACPIYTRGCSPIVTDILSLVIEAAGGAAIGLAFLELIGVFFSCFLTKRIKDGFA